MKTLACSLAALAALTAAAPMHAQDNAAAVARQLVVRSGLAVQLRSVPKGFEQQMKELKGQLPDSIYASMQRAGREAFNPEALQAEIETSLPARLSVPEMRKALAWLDTEPGRRVTRAEETSSATIDSAALQRYAEQSKGKPPSAQRKKLLQDLIEATASVESAASLIEATSLGVAIGMDSTQPVQKRAGAAKLRAELEKAMPRDQLRKTLGASLPGLFAYTYREVSDKDLASYLAFLRSAGGKKYNDAMLEAYTQAVVAASVRMGQLVDQTEKPRT